MTSGVWTCLGGRVIAPAPFCPVGILNLTPDSFSDGSGAVPAPADSLARARAMQDALTAYGCGLLDLGAESTRPHAVPVSPAEELARLLPVLEPLAASAPAIPLSVDTCRAVVAARALDLGALAINDVSAGSRDPALLDVLVQYRPGYVLTHGGAAHFAGMMSMAETAPDVPPVDQLLRFFEAELARLTRAGLPEANIVLDPGIGFGKSCAESWAILRYIDRLSALGRPLYAGLSRKSLFAGLGLPPGERDTATQTAIALLAARGIAYHRVHDVPATIRTLRIVSASTR